MEIFKGKNLLLVDDDPSNIFALSAALEDFELNITVAQNGVEAVNAVVVDPSFEMILMDIMMPEMDGFEAMRLIREKGFKLPIIALTAKVMKGDIDKCYEAGASDYMPKPIDVEKLVVMMAKWFNQPV